MLWLGFSKLTCSCFLLFLVFFQHFTNGISDWIQCITIVPPPLHPYYAPLCISTVSLSASLLCSPLHPYCATSTSLLCPCCILLCPSTSLLCPSLHCYCAPLCIPIYCAPSASLLCPLCIPIVPSLHPYCVPSATLLCPSLHPYCAPLCIPIVSPLHPYCAPFAFLVCPHLLVRFNCPLCISCVPLVIYQLTISNRRKMISLYKQNQKI